MLRYILIIQLLFTAIFVNAQPSPGKVVQRVTKEQHAEFLRKRRAELMADSLTAMLGLSKSVREKLLNTNLLIENEKAAAWKAITDRKILSERIQAIEKQRNESYNKILTPKDFLIYVYSKKRKIAK